MPSFDEPFRAAFADWVQAKCGTAEALRQASRDPGVTFETIQVPTMEQRLEGKNGAFRDPRTQRFVRGEPTPPELPEEAWINRPDSTPITTQLHTKLKRQLPQNR